MSLADTFGEGGWVGVCLKRLCGAIHVSVPKKHGVHVRSKAAPSLGYAQWTCVTFNAGGFRR